MNELAKKVEGSRSSYYYRDFYTNFISSQLDSIVNNKKVNENKDLERVLIIDDLDRIDPEHIFRLLNVFSAHFDYLNRYKQEKLSKNKFGFDKIIFVCDINNIRKIFKHKYGGDVDFGGYIDKFFSHNIFEFDNRSAVREWLNDILSNLRGTQLRLIEMDAIFLEDIIVHMLNFKTINLRSLLKLDINSLMPAFENLKAKKKHNQFNSLYLTKIIAILTAIVGDKIGLLDNLKTCSLEFSQMNKPLFSSEENSATYFSHYILPVIDFTKHNFDTREDVEYSYYPDRNNVTSYAKYKLVHERSSYLMERIFVTHITTSTIYHHVFILPKLIEATKILYEVSAIH